MNKWFLSILYLLAGFVSSAQTTGTIDFPEFGIRFTIPEGWGGQESEDAYLIRSAKIPGIIYLRLNEFGSIEKVKEASSEGIVEEGILLSLQGEFEPVGGGISAPFTGMIQGTPVRAHVAALLHPFGQDLLILTAVDKNSYTEEYKNLTNEFAAGVEFYPPVIPENVQKWKQDLQGMKVSYLKSNYSTGGGSGYSGYSEKEEIWLCASGSFEYYSDFSGSFDSNPSLSGTHTGTYGFTHNKEDGAGSWDVVTGVNGGPVLQLHFKNGNLKSYTIDGVDGGKLYLNGYGYFYSSASDFCQ